MEILNYILTALTVFSGTILGFFVSWIAEEELKYGKKYFLFLENSVFSLIVLFGMLVYNYLIAIIISIAVFIFLFFSKKIPENILKFKYYIYFLILSILFYFSSKSFNLFILQSSLIFLYGFPFSALVFENSIKRKKPIIFLEIVKKSLIFLVFSLILFLINL